jgi:hypothetical protein
METAETGMMGCRVCSDSVAAAAMRARRARGLARGEEPKVEVTAKVKVERKPESRPRTRVRSTAHQPVGSSHALLTSLHSPSRLRSYTFYSPPRTANPSIGCQSSSPSSLASNSFW